MTHQETQTTGPDTALLARLIADRAEAERDGFSAVLPAYDAAIAELRARIGARTDRSAGRAP